MTEEATVSNEAVRISGESQATSGNETGRVLKGVLGLLAAIALFLAATSVVQTVRRFYQLDFPVTWVADGIEVGTLAMGSSADIAGLKEGDLVLRVDGKAIDQFEDPIFIMAAGDDHVLTVQSLFGDLREAVFLPPPPEVDSVYLARSTVAFIGLICAIYTVFVTSRKEAATFLLLAIACLFVAAIPHRVAASEESLRILHRAASAAIPFFLLRFFIVFPEGRRIPPLYDVTTVFVLTLVAVSAVVPSGDAWWSAAKVLLRVGFGLALIAGVVLQVRRWRATIRIAMIRRQIEWAALGLFVGLFPFAFLVLLPEWLGIGFEPFSWIAIFPIVAVPFGFSAALAEYRLWDLEPISRDLLSGTLVLAVGGFAFTATNYLLLRYGGGLGPLRNLAAFATGVLLVVLLQPMRFEVQRFLDRWLHHGRPAPRWLLTDSTRILAQAIDPRELLHRLSETLHEGLEIELVSTYLRLADGSFELVSGGPPSLPNRIPFLVVENEFPFEHEDVLKAEGYTLRIPLERAGTIHGLLYLGLRRGIFPLGSEGREVVSAFAAQAGLALESARLLDDLRRQADEYRILHTNTQRIIESSAAAILVCDATGRILSVNSEAAGIFGSDGEELVAVALDSLVDLPDGWEPHLPMHAANAECSTLSSPQRRVIMAVSVLELDSGSFNGRVVVLQDVTELRSLQDRVRENERMASLGRLASGLAHEINTPLTGIASFAQMLSGMTDEDDPRAELVAKLEDQSFRVSRIVANLHSAVRGSRSERTLISLGDVVQRSTQDAMRSVGESREVEVVVPPHPIHVWGANGPVELAVSNLVRNALEASPEGGEVRVEVMRTTSWGEVHVDDCGSGIPDEIRQKVFEPFFSTKTERGGTGLGLAISRDMIANLGGEIELTTSPLGGARVTIRLQRWEEPAQSS
ncbi:MAG: PAS domain S-box protein [bacterium]|nr:PAS domain S-box protein [bacterium]